MWLAGSHISTPMMASRATGDLLHRVSCSLMTTSLLLFQPICLYFLCQVELAQNSSSTLRLSGETDVFACSQSRGTRRALLSPSDVSRLASLTPLGIWGSTVLFPALFSLLVNGRWIVSRTFATFSKLIFSCVSQPAKYDELWRLLFAKVSQV